MNYLNSDLICCLITAVFFVFGVCFCILFGLCICCLVSNICWINGMSPKWTITWHKWVNRSSAVHKPRANQGFSFGEGWGSCCIPVSLSLQCSAIEQILDILTDILSWGNSQGGFRLPSSRFVIRDCDQSFPSPRHCLSTAPSLSGATLLSIPEGVPLPATRGHGGHRRAPAVCQSLTSADPTVFQCIDH